MASTGMKPSKEHAEDVSYLVKYDAKPIITGKSKATRVAANDSSFSAVAKAA